MGAFWSLTDFRWVARVLADGVPQSLSNVLQDPRNFLPTGRSRRRNESNLSTAVCKPFDVVVIDVTASQKTLVPR